MKNFLRALRCAFPYRRRLIVSIVCAMMAAVLWGLNLTAIYPVLTILVNKQSLQDWVNTRIEQTQKDIDGWQTDVDAYTKSLKELEDQPPSKFRDKKISSLSRESA